MITGPGQASHAYRLDSTVQDTLPEAPRRSQAPTHPLTGRGTRPHDANRQGGTNPRRGPQTPTPAELNAGHTPNGGVSPERQRHRQHTPGTGYATGQVRHLPTTRPEDRFTGGAN